MPCVISARVSGPCMICGQPLEPCHIWDTPNPEDMKLYCAECCPEHKPAEPWHGKPQTITGEQKGLFEK